MKQLIPLSLCLLLSSCIDPYMMDMGRNPYNDPYGSQYRQDMQNRGQNLNAMAYERGQADGQNDAQRRQSQNYNRYRSSRFERSTELAYRDGYNDGYERSSSSLNNLNRPPYGSGGYYPATPPAPGGTYIPPQPGGTYVPPQPGGSYPPQSYTPPPQTPQAEPKDAAYQQGFDYGVRDRTGGRVADPATHVGRYDPRKRSNFERGYYDGYNMRSSSGGSPRSTGGGRFWSL